MRKISKILSLGMMLVFILTIFKPYSALASEITPTLNINQNGEYIVSSVKDINSLRNDIDKGIDYSGKSIILTQDIDISKSEEKLNSFTTAKEFNGIFDGKFHTISGYTDAKSGLFVVIGKNSIIKNVRIDANVVIKDKEEVLTKYESQREYGLIANIGEGTITRCSSTGTITNKEFVFRIAGIVGSNTNIYKGGYVSAGHLTDCYSNVIFNNQSKKDGSRGGICGECGKTIEHCYFYGKFIGEYSGHGDHCEPIVTFTYYDQTTKVMTEAKNCAVDREILGRDDKYCHFSGSPKIYTTEEMKKKESYTALGFDFDKTWKINSSVNDGYPYLNTENVGKELTKVVVDLKVTAANKTYDINATVDENLKTKMSSISIVTQDDKYKDLIDKYHVTASYDGDVTFSAPTIGDVPINLGGGEFKIAYDQNNEYEFVKGKVSVDNAKLLDNGAASPTESKQKEQIENVKKAQDIMYNKLASKLLIDKVHEFGWSGEKASSVGKEGKIIFCDGDWGVFSSARSGYKGIKPGFYDEWFKSIQTGLKKMKEAGITAQDVKMTEWEKLVLAITAIGYDPRDIEAYDLIDIISNEDYLKASEQIFAGQYAVLALNSYNYTVPQSGNRIDKEAKIHDWAQISTTAADGSVILENMASDMAVMGFQPIADYYNPNAQKGDKYYDVKLAMEHEFSQFSNAQTYKGSFWGGYGNQYNNPWTNAQVYMTLGMAKVNIFDKKYIKNGKSVLDGALEFYNINEGTTVFNDSTYDPAQMCRGLDSLVRAYEGRNSIFDCTDVKDSTVPVNNAITSLPPIINSDNKKDVEKAQALYDRLTDAKKASIKESTKVKLAAAQKALSSSDTLKISNLTGQEEVKLGKDAKISIKVDNNSGKDQDVAVIAALYDHNNKFIDYVCGNQTIKNGDSSIVTNMIKLPKEGTYKLKVFVWDSIKNMKPLSNVIDIPVKLNK